MNWKHVKYEEADGVATITLARPDKLNALTFDIYAELREGFRWLETQKHVRSVLLTGEGRGFCSGGDVNDIIGELFARPMPGLVEFTRMTCDVILNMRRLRKPIVCALNGTAAGAGAVLALASDLRIASETAKIAFLFVKVGLAGADMGSAFLLPRVVGLSRATELLYFGDAIDAATAERYGLFNKVVPADKLQAEARAWAKRLAEGPSFALGITKDALNEELATDLATALEAEARAQAVCMQTKDFREAYDAFVGKRPAKFQGA